jgi:hypothetical protein
MAVSAPGERQQQGSVVAAVDREGSGWVLFAAIALGVAGIMRIFDAIWAFQYHGVLPANLENAIFGHSLKTYGWIFLVVAAVYIFAALTVMNGSQVARWIGIIAGAVGAISAIWWMPYYPIWSLLYVAVGALVTYALVVHGGPLTDA